MPARRVVKPLSYSWIFIAMNTLPEFIDEVQDHTDDNADDDACGQGKVKGEMFFFDQDISWQPSQKREPREDQHHEAYYDQDRPDEDHDPCQLSHG
jgi:hypothetical protein